MDVDRALIARHLHRGIEFQRVASFVELPRPGIKFVELDDERRAAMVSNLMVVLCGERDTQPVVNAGSLYQ